MDSSYECAYCGAGNEIWVDPSQGDEQTYLEDCQVCCRPNLLHVFWNDVDGVFEAEASPES